MRKGTICHLKVTKQVWYRPQMWSTSKTSVFVETLKKNTMYSVCQKQISQLPIVCVFRTSWWLSWRNSNRKSWTRIFWRSKEQKTSHCPAYRRHHYHPDQVPHLKHTWNVSLHPTCDATFFMTYLCLFLAKKKEEEDEDDMADLEAWAAN